MTQVPQFALTLGATITKNFLKLEELGAKTLFFSSPFLEKVAENISAQAGVGPNSIKFVLCLLLVYPLGFIFSYVRGKNLRHLFSLIFGLFLVQFSYKEQWIHSFVTSIITYICCLILPKKRFHHAVFIFMMGYLTCVHMYRMYVDYGGADSDFSGTQMVLTMKLTSFAYNLFDGTTDYKNVFEHPDDLPEHKKKVYKSRRQFAITKTPNLLEFLGYTYSFTSVLVGPAFEYNEYVRVVDDSINTKIVDGKKVVVRPNGKIRGFLTCLVSLALLGGHVVLASKFSIYNMFNPVNVNKGYLFMFYYMIVSNYTERLRYYFAWKSAEGSNNFAGFGFDGYDEKGNEIGWAASSNVDLLNFDTSTCMQNITRFWNLRTQGWLERYTYLRTNRSLFATYFISALWHGLYPGYFLFFLIVPVMTQIEREMRTKINPLIYGPDYKTKVYPKLQFSLFGGILKYKRDLPSSFIEWVYAIVCWLGTFISLIYVIQVFFFLTWEKCMASYRYFKFSIHIALFVFLFLLKLIPAPKSKESKEKKTK